MTTACPPPPQPHPLAELLLLRPFRNLPIRHRHLPLLPDIGRRPSGISHLPALFNFYVSDFPHNNAQVTSYADDFTAATSHNKLDEAARALSAHSTSAGEWADRKGLKISLNKSGVTLFTNWTAQYHDHTAVPLGNRALLLGKKPKVLYRYPIHPAPEVSSSYLLTPC